MAREQFNLFGGVDHVGEERSRSSTLGRTVALALKVALLGERVVILEACLEEISEARPLTRSVTGESSCRHFPECDHPCGIQLVTEQRRARRALRESRGIRVQDIPHGDDE